MALLRASNVFFSKGNHVEWPMFGKFKHRTFVCYRLFVIHVSMHFSQKWLVEAVKISIEFNLSDHVLNSHDLTN